MQIASIAAIAGLGALLAAPAQAAPIIGTISLSDGFDAAGLPTAPSTSIVSGLTSVNVQSGIDVQAAGSGTDTFAGTNSATAFDLLPPALPTTFFTTDTGLTFTITSLSVASSSALRCAGGLCSDAVVINVGGVVSGAGFDDTAFLDSRPADGSCLDSSRTGTSSISASWPASLVATGSQVPEPGSLALLGLGLAGLGFTRRRARPSYSSRRQ